MKEQFLQILNQEINRVKHLGMRRLADGTALIGHVPHVAPEAYLHTIYHPLQHDKIEILQEQAQTQFPQDFIEFLGICNGILLFSTQLAIHGYKRNYARIGDESRQPFDLALTNVYERPANAQESHLFIGSYSSDGSLLYIDNQTGQVFRRGPKWMKPKQEWNNLWEMLTSEMQRLSLLFDDNGVLRR